MITYLAETACDTGSDFSNINWPGALVIVAIIVAVVVILVKG